MFWRFGGYAQISSLDSVLDKPDVTLEEVLDDQDLITELKSQNAKVIEFIRDEAHLRKLLEYVISSKPAELTGEEEGEDEPTQSSAKSPTRGFFNSRSKSRDPTDAEEKERKRLKYAFTASEVFCTGVNSIYDALFENTDHLRMFWDYLKQDAPLDPIQSSYFTKVNEALLEKKPTETLKFIMSRDDVVGNLTKHIDCPVMMDLLLKLISLEKDTECQGIVDWLQQQKLVPTLLSFISHEHPSATQTAAGDFLKAIITISANATTQDQTVIGPNELTRELVSESCMRGLAQEMLKGGEPLTVGVGIIIEVIRKNNSDYDSEAQVGPEPKSSDPIYLGTLLGIYAEHVKDFMELILSKEHTVSTASGHNRVPRKDIGVAWGQKIEPLGFDRFKTCELMAELLHCSNMGLLNEKGSDAAVKFRDRERERLKEEGTLTAQSRAEQEEFSASYAFATSVDSEGFHHAEANAPLAESPDPVRRLEVQNNTEDEEFEKVNLSEVSDTTQGAGKTSEGSTGTKHRSLLTQQLESQQEGSMSLDSPDNVDAKSSDAPAPLFASRPNKPDAEQASPSTDVPMDTESASEQPQDIPVIDTEDDGSPLVGDLLKMKFVEHKVVPTILDFFFRFPWNNFLHNVVYDVVQQVFNGSMDRGHNRHLAIDMFEQARITERIVEGHNRNDKSEKESNRRLGYMGHLTLIAEEVTKFADRSAGDYLSPSVESKLNHEDFQHYVTVTLPDIRERDNAVLGGFRPDNATSHRQSLLNAVNAGGVFGGGGGSSALAEAGLGGGNTALDSMDLASAGSGLYGNAQVMSRFGGSDEEEEEELEEGELGGQTAEHGNDIAESSDNAGQNSSIPAPLVVTPSRARLQLAARLAEKQRQATAGQPDAAAASTSAAAGGAAHDSGLLSVPQDNIAGGSSSGSEIEDEGEEDPGEQLTTNTGRVSQARRAGGLDNDNDDDDDDEDDEEEDEPASRFQIKRQTTREAIERQPLDVGDDDDDEDDDEPAPLSIASRSRAGGNTSSIEDRFLAEKRMEQEKLLRQWGFSGTAGGVGGAAQQPDDDNSSDDEPVAIGSKYMKRSMSKDK